MKKKHYSTPEMEVLRIRSDIITFSENEAWTGPILEDKYLGESGNP